MISGMAWHGVAEVHEGAPVAVSGWVLTDGHDLAPCAANGLHRETITVNLEPPSTHFVPTFVANGAAQAL